MKDDKAKQSKHPRPRWGKTRADKAKPSERPAIRKAAVLARVRLKVASKPVEVVDATEF